MPSLRTSGSGVFPTRPLPVDTVPIPQTPMGMGTVNNFRSDPDSHRKVCIVPRFERPTVLGWGDARDVPGLAACTAMWLRGHLADHPRGAVLDPEINDLKPLLIRLNEAGILTVRSQHGLARGDGYQQRAAIEMRMPAYPSVSPGPILVDILTDFPDLLVVRNQTQWSWLRRRSRLDPGLPVQRTIEAPHQAISATPARGSDPEGRTEIHARWGAQLHVSEAGWPRWDRERNRYQMHEVPTVAVLSRHWGADDGGLWKMLEAFLDRLDQARAKWGREHI